MADNVAFTTYTVKTDDIGSAHVQYVKLMDGTDGGTAGTNYKVACKIVTNAGRTDERTIWIKVVNR